MKNKVAVILVNYNAQKYMREFFESVYLQDYSDIEIVLVDNVSTDSSLAWLKENAPRVHLIEMQENVGFGEGCNIGMQYALEELGVEYILLLNIDTVLQTNLVSELLKYADEKTVTTPRIYCGEKDSAMELWYAGGEIDIRTAQVHQILYPIPESEVYEVEFISGCCMMLHRDIIDKIGYLDSQFFLYYEDTDYCVRMRNAGIVMKYITTTSLWHKVGGSSLEGSETSCSTQYYVERNRLLFADKYFQLFENGNLSVMRDILKERAFFDGIENEKYRFYIQTAIADYLKGYFGKGYYGRILLEKGYYIANGFYEREECGEQYWYWASERCSTIYLANHKKQAGIYTVTFDLASAVTEKKQILEIAVDGKHRRKYIMPGQVEFDVPIGGESLVRLDMTFHGIEKTDEVEGNKRTLFYQLLNLGVIENDRNYCVIGKTYLEEQDGNDSWQWSAEKVCKIYIINRELHKIVYIFKAVVESVDGNKYDIRINTQGKNLAKVKTMEECCIPIGMNANEICELELKCEAPIVFDHGRRVCFKLKNIVIQEAGEELYWGECFLPEEGDSDGENIWRWSTEKQGSMRLVNQSAEIFMWKHIAFRVQPYEKGLSGGIHIYQNGVDVTEQSEREGYVNMLIGMTPKETLQLDIVTDWPIAKDGERDICFCVMDIIVEEFEKEIFFGNTFRALEGDGVNTWTWNTKNIGSIAVINRRNTFMQCVMEFEIIPYGEDFEVQEGKIVIGESVERIKYGKRKRLFLNIASFERISMILDTALPVQELDGQNFCFQVRNANLKILPSGLYFEDTFYAEESSGEFFWRWCEENHGKLYIANVGNSVENMNLEFEVMDLEKQKSEFEVWHDKKQLLHGVCGKKYSLQINVKAQDIEEIKVLCHTSQKYIDGRTLCFGIRNLKITSV